MDKRKLAFILGALLLVGTVFGAWQFFMGSSYNAHVVSEGVVVSISTGFDDCPEMDTTFDDAECVSTATISNMNGVRDADVVIAVDKTDTTDGCTDYIDDCSVVVEYIDGIEVVELTDGGDMIIQEGDTFINSTITCIEDSCEQDLTVTVNLTDLGERIDHEIPVVAVLSNGNVAPGSITVNGTATDDWSVDFVEITLLGGDELGNNYYDGVGFDSATPVWLNASYNEATEIWTYDLTANPTNSDVITITARATDISSKQSLTDSEQITVIV